MNGLHSDVRSFSDFRIENACVNAKVQLSNTGFQLDESYLCSRLFSELVFPFSLAEV